MMIKRGKRNEWELVPRPCSHWFCATWFLWMDLTAIRPHICMCFVSRIHQGTRMRTLQSMAMYCVWSPWRGERKQRCFDPSPKREKTKHIDGIMHAPFAMNNPKMKYIPIEQIDPIIAIIAKVPISHRIFFSLLISDVISGYHRILDDGHYSRMLVSRTHPNTSRFFSYLYLSCLCLSFPF